MSRLKNNTIRQKLMKVNLYQSTIPMIVLVVILMSVIIMFSITQMYQRSNDIMRSIEVASERDLNQYDNKLDEIYEVIVSNNESDKIDEMLLAYVESNEEILSLLILDNSGVTLNGAPYELIDIGHDYSGHSYFKELGVIGDVYWSDIFIVYGSNIPMVSIAKKYNQRTVVLQIDLEALTNFLSTFEISNNSYIAITDQSGTYLAHSDYDFVTTRGFDENRIDLMEEQPKLITYNDRYMLAFHQQLSENNWSIIFYQSILDMIAPLLTLVGVGLLAIVLISFRVIKSVVGLNNELSSQMDELVDWSDKVAKGQYDIDQRKSSIQEFNNLYSAFGVMTQNVLSREALLEEHRQEIIEINKGLEIEVKNRTKDLKKSLVNLENAQGQLIQREKMASIGRMVSGVAHELNTPIGVALTAITYLEQKNAYYLKRLLDQQMSKDDLATYMKTVEESSEIIFRNMTRASDLISSFKRVAVDQEKMKIEVMNLQEIVEATVTSLGVEMKRKAVGIELSFIGDMVCESYPGAFSQIITNLIQNSLLHAFDDVDEGLINLECIESNDQEKMTIRYEDNGKGIEEKDIGKIYEPFYTTALSIGGTGLGMNIVYNLVTGSLGGHIQYKSKAGQGVLFELIIPKKIS